MNQVKSSIFFQSKGKMYEFNHLPFNLLYSVTVTWTHRLQALVLDYKGLLSFYSQKLEKNKSQLQSSCFTSSLSYTLIIPCSHLYCGGGIPLASQVRVASSSMESTGINRSPGSILHLGPWNDPLSRQSVRGKHSCSRSIRGRNKTAWG